jgi:hypothetical protein
MLYGVKGTNLPSYEVFAATGKHCFSFELKSGLKQGRGPVGP